jgi:hypothetical protein
MAKNIKPAENWLQIALMRVSRLHFVYVAIYVAAIIMFDSWNLLPHEAVAQRWTAAGILLGVTTFIWYIGRLKLAGQVYGWLILALALADITFASFNVYWQRGMASKAVMLYVVALVSAAATRSRSSVLAIAALSVGAYTTAAVRYFNLNYGEGFRVALYGEILFYSALMFVVVWLLFILIRPAGKV